MRRFIFLQSYKILLISIHSSQAGWDLMRKIFISTLNNFNPLIPSGMRQHDKQHVHHLHCISIHSSQAGWDKPRYAQGLLRYEFQSTHPKRDETFCCELDTFVFLISIHSSQAGWDQSRNLLILRFCNFNPLIPSGMRQYSFLFIKHFNYFNPLIPSGMRRLLVLCSPPVFGFQSTHPKRDETFPFLSQHNKKKISIHSSQAGWDFGADIHDLSWEISIHSSQAGWDRKD